MARPLQTRTPKRPPPESLNRYFPAIFARTCLLLYIRWSPFYYMPNSIRKSPLLLALLVACCSLPVLADDPHIYGPDESPRTWYNDTVAYGLVGGTSADLLKRMRLNPDGDEPGWKYYRNQVDKWRTGLNDILQNKAPSLADKTVADLQGIVRIFEKHVKHYDEYLEREVGLTAKTNGDTFYSRRADALGPHIWEKLSYRDVRKPDSEYNPHAKLQALRDDLQNTYDVPYDDALYVFEIAMHIHCMGLKGKGVYQNSRDLSKDDLIKPSRDSLQPLSGFTLSQIAEGAKELQDVLDYYLQYAKPKNDVWRYDYTLKMPILNDEYRSLLDNKYGDQHSWIENSQAQANLDAALKYLDEAAKSVASRCDLSSTQVVWDDLFQERDNLSIAWEGLREYFSNSKAGIDFLSEYRLYVPLLTLKGVIEKRLKSD